MSNVFEEFERPETEIPAAEALEGESLFVPELGGKYEVYGDPYELGERLDDEQGDNSFNAQGDCGLVSIANLLTAAGLKIDEEDVVGYAVNHGLCVYGTFTFPSNRGGTTFADRESLLNNLGVETRHYFADTPEGSPEAVAQYIEDGRGVLLAVNSGYIWNDPDSVGSGKMDHCVFATGTVRDPETGELKGLIVCDSGRIGEPSAANFISMEQLKYGYVEADFADCIVTDQAIR